MISKDRMTNNIININCKTRDMISSIIVAAVFEIIANYIEENKGD